MSDQEARDLDRAEEYEKMNSRVAVLGQFKFEISSGLIIASRYADKLRRVALVTLGKMIPKDIIMRDIAELNKELYNKIVNELKVNKLDVIRLMVDVEYNPQEKKLQFSNIRIIRYYTEEECKKMGEDLIKENEKLKDELEQAKKKIEEIKNIIQ
ncbi:MULTISPECIES: DUF2258 domain-containing protein [Acidianus]|uniref:DUF2258 domain-containing protein n=1 Tax=Candidatus Acidianus copahuensis TaxID=1160895 RepID=A0A031LY15_9CREN|nr:MULTISPECIES: single- stranded DNA-binding family protein [Acidianus]EZQ12043.1 hypothetical protein CM19_00295 [Candidatus Acidianus copahuensis]NON63056.1 DUF2258 domain-containing protein [Acidianus sp. RZ1]